MQVRVYRTKTGNLSQLSQLQQVRLGQKNLMKSMVSQLSQLSQSKNRVLKASDHQKTLQKPPGGGCFVGFGTPPCWVLDSTSGCG